MSNVSRLTYEEIEDYWVKVLEHNDWYETELGWTHIDFDDEFCSFEDAVEYNKEMNEGFKMYIGPGGKMYSSGVFQ